MRITLIVLFLASLLCAAKHPVRHSGPVSTAKEAKAIAEQDTGGMATYAHRIPLNAASGGWEVDIFMPHETRGWRCVIDNDTHMVHTKERIPNPDVQKRHRNRSGVN